MRLTLTPNSVYILALYGWANAMTSSVVLKAGRSRLILSHSDNAHKEYSVPRVLPAKESVNFSLFEGWVAGIKFSDAPPGWPPGLLDGGLVGGRLLLAEPVTGSLVSG